MMFRIYEHLLGRVQKGSNEMVKFIAANLNRAQEVCVSCELNLSTQPEHHIFIHSLQSRRALSDLE